MRSAIRLLRELCNRNGHPCVYLTLGLALGFDLREFAFFIIEVVKTFQ